MKERIKRVNVVTMGCSKNLVDSEVLLNQLERGNWTVAHDSGESGFDAVIINTCGFIHDAKQESIDMILSWADAKARGDVGKLYVMGCLSERYKTELEQEIPEVDRYFGKFDLKAVAGELKVALQPEFIYERKITTPSHYAYLKVSEGCNLFCGFCAIPMMTGRHVSRSVEELVKETRFLASRGVKELLLIAQDLSYYGHDLYGESRLAQLTGKIAEVEGIEWIRLHYFYPSRFPFDILPVMRANPKVLRYMDLPLQHISDPVLSAMKRRISRDETEALLRRIRKEVPGVVIRTTLLVGYPGETDADFEELLTFVEEQRFDRLGVFPYSHEEGTFAFENLVDDVPEKVKQERVARLMELQEGISAELNEDKVGMKLRVIIDREEGEFYIGRTRFDSPEVDGEVFVKPERKLLPGEFAEVRITGADIHDLYGRLVTGRDEHS
ncbi:MAG: 30S ribosomal protein S12 methylthiotransferase RimO [Prolixibacteraceae bacterium]